ncbi:MULTISPECIES: response regulator transcription factor [unclassified Campylobacter]|uniref:response regulator transcription factor n=1 Tax=unclassified Campylobacter TaxID=2593542 RepID=UPI001237D458|nr:MULTISPECIES: response regulator transcription factor [unclassified Campylobacter]KAA6225100.1 response regulator transcription factor [Campylobacter sp. LR196d]KAA6226114.1 response regulator transcription factor [Campylobacter sp. LR185c]KAA6228061.1 response regulator transcription factor [Campylobacter sp. LR286c]KAA6231314.1 response regulator transcription factor [Campylobacter sp. LR264d]KAA6231526.1 response regulator transcription factor [Campylobacter sp. LR291e]
MIFVLEDDEKLLNLILYALNSSNLQAKGFSTPLQFWKELEKQIPKCIILDIMLPNESGLQILTKLRTMSKTKHLPIMLLSALSTELDKITGLDMGSDDYLSKPFSTLELIARIKALLRRTSDDEVLSYKGLKYSKNTHLVSIDDENITLTLKEFDLLGLLMKNYGRVFSRDELLELVWGYNVSSTRTVDMHINTLRFKLKQYGKAIKTIHGLGYKFSIDE